MIRLNYPKLILASASPRRQTLLSGMGFEFEVRKTNVEETYPADLYREKIPVFLAEKKANSLKLEADEIAITADTIVWQKDHVLHKPDKADEAIKTLETLSNGWHEVITGVCIRTRQKEMSFYSETSVLFKSLTKEEIIHYIEIYKPYDKAGSYGIQEWIGYIGIKEIRGSYFNVMGLPTQKLYEYLKFFSAQ